MDLRNLLKRQWPNVLERGYKMKVKDPNFVLEKIQKYLTEDIIPSRYRETMEIEFWKYLESSMDEKIDKAYSIEFNDYDWQDFRLWDTWGGYDKVAWFRTTVKIPESFKNSQIGIKLLVGPRDGGDSTAETLLYINGSPVQGMDIWHEEALLEAELCEQEELHLALKAWSGVLAPPKFRTFKVAQLVKLDMKVDKFCFVLDTLIRSIKLIEENDLKHIKLKKLLNDTIHKVNFLNYKEEDYYQSIYTALDFVQGEMDQLAQMEEIKPTVYGVGHSHIDMAWLWRLNATREKASRTFSSVLNLMKQYPEYKFMHSSPQLYQFLKEDYPEIFAQVKERIDKGQWEITGGMWVEPDTNIPSGESLVRQFLYGKRYIKKEFGKETTLVWLPDVFGYSAALPQIMIKSGMKYFMTTKISWNQYNHFPYDTFLWKGMDGSEIFTHFITTPEDGSWFYTYNGHMDPEEVTGVWNNYKDKDKNDKLLIAYGWGDGGGGPTREMLEQSRVMKNIPGIPKVQMSGAEEYFEKIYEHTDHSALGKWDGELYFELHRGTYTSQAANKRYNRKIENMFHNLEFLLSAADIRNNENAYPKAELDTMWERVLLNQFHDILPGSSIRQVYEDTTKDYEEIKAKASVLLETAIKGMAQGIDVSEDGIAIYNTTGFKRNDYVFIPYGGKVKSSVQFSDGTGEVSSQETSGGILLYIKNLPSYGYKTLHFVSKQEEDRPIISMTKNRAENPYYVVGFNENGEISYLYDKENNREVSCGTPMNVLTAYEDKPQRFDAWDLDIYYKEKPYTPFMLKESKVTELGTERSILHQVWVFNKSTVTQDFVLYGSSRRIDFHTTVDWREEQVFLKTYFPVRVHSEEATYEIQFGNIKRPTHTNNEWDFAKFEVPAHRWADLSEGDYGVSLLNDCKYGWDIHENVIGLSLIKSAIRPDKTADKGIHTFSYALLPHKGNVTGCEVQKEAVSFNIPVLIAGLTGRKDAPEFSAYSFVETDSAHVLIDTVKKAEEGEAYIVRLYEYKNIRDENVTLSFGHPVKKVMETNLCEEGGTEIFLENNRISFNVGCYEIKTFKIYL